MGVQPYGDTQSGRACPDNGYLLSVTFGLARCDVTLAKGSFGNGGFVFADSDRLVAREFQYARLLAEGGADASRKFGKVVRAGQYPVSFAPFAPVECVLEFRVFIAQRTCPVAERYATVHAA